MTQTTALILSINLKGAREWCGGMSDGDLRSERAQLDRLADAGMADGSDKRIVAEEMKRRGLR